MDFCADLTNEALVEMADTFFSRRREIDLRKKVLLEKVQELRLKAEHIDAKWRTLRRLLLQDASALKALTAAMHFDPEELCCIVVDEDHIFRFAPPWSLTKRGRYIKSVEHVYDALCEDVRDYNDGTSSPDSDDKRRIIVSTHYVALKQMYDEINRDVDTINESQPTSCVLGFARNLDVVEMERRKVSGATFQNASERIDSSMALAKLTQDDFNLPAIPTPPLWNELKQTMEPILTKIYEKKAEEVRAAIDGLLAN